MKWTSRSEIEEGEERAAGFVLFRTFRQRRQYLLLRHRDGEHWSFPKGRLEPKESEIEAAIRETHEETNLRQLHPVLGFRETCSYTTSRNGREKPKTVTYFLAETTESDVQLSAEHTAYQWLEFAEAVATLTHGGSRRILTDADALLTIFGECEQNNPQ
jgi:bis(5'-nucleosidyl)-tetraphosphatase